MTKKRLFMFIVFFLIVMSLSFYVWIYYLQSKPAALLVESQPVSQVFIDGVKVGMTPYEGEFEAKEVRIKLIPQSFEQALVPYEVKLNLESGVKTIVRRKLGEVEGEGSGLIVSFDKTDLNETSISVVTVPDAAQVFIDGAFVDVSPTKQIVEPGEHELKVDGEGYQEMSLTLQAVPRYDLTAVVELEKNELERKSENKETETEKQKIKILETPVGYLRVRAQAAVNSEEISQVKPGEEFELIEESSDKDWFKIKLSDNEEGWISAQYATISAIRLSE